METIVGTVIAYLVLGLLVSACTVTLSRAFLGWVADVREHHRKHSRKARLEAARRDQIRAFVQMTFQPKNVANEWIAANDIPYRRKLDCITAGMTVAQARETIEWDDETVAAYGVLTREERHRKHLETRDMQSLMFLSAS